MRVLVACEFSGVVRRAFRALGHDAYSCDTLPAEDGDVHHLLGDVLGVDGRGDSILGGGIGGTWDLMIAHPPCTHLAVSGARWFKDKAREQADALDFVRALLDAPIPRIALENPISVISTRIRKPDQIIQPYWFGDTARKATCLWLKNLPPLEKTNVVEPDIYTCKNGKTFSRDYMVALSAGKNRGHLRSRTYAGIAAAMATQWGELAS